MVDEKLSREDNDNTRQSTLYIGDNIQGYIDDDWLLVLGRLSTVAADALRRNRRYHLVAGDRWAFMAHKNR